jgi:hypothetical protein
MASAEVKSFDKPEETRPFEGKGKADVVTLAGRNVGRATFEPGWKWSVNVKPIMKTDSCEGEHLGYCLQGRMRVTMNDGTKVELGPGDAFHIEPGHDAEVVGNETCIALDFGSFGDYAKKK